MAGSTVPVTLDLTTEDLSISILRGIENMHRRDVPLKAAEVLESGDWAVLNASGEAERAGATPVAESFPVFLGTERFDVSATGQVTLIMNDDVIIKSSKFDPAPTYAIGDALTVKDLGGGESTPTKQSGAEPVLARVLEIGPNDEYLTYRLVGSSTGN